MFPCTWTITPMAFYGHILYRQACDLVNGIVQKVALECLLVTNMKNLTAPALLKVQV